MDYLREFVAGSEAAHDVDPASLVLVTPRDQSSKYVVFLFLRPGSREPSYVAKISRLPEYDGRLQREGSVLAAVHAARVGGLETIPRVLRMGRQEGHLILLQTALAGRAVDHATMRRHRDESVAAVLEWLGQLPVHSDAAAVDPEWFERLVETPLRHIGEVLAEDREALVLVERTRALLEPLRREPIPLVLEHGDVGHPNLIRLRDGRVGVIDWELAELHGLPAHDLFFFLTYAAFAARRAWHRKRQLRAFHETFFRPDGWALRPVSAYADALRLPPRMLGPLFLCCWARQTAGLVGRVEGAPLALRDAPEPPPRRLRRSMTAYIQQNAYYALWRHAVEHRERLPWWPGG